MKHLKIFGVAMIALAFASCYNSMESEIVTAAVTGGEPQAIISNIRFARGTDPSVVSEANKANWNPKSVYEYNRVLVAFDVNTDKKITEIKYVEWIAGEILGEVYLAKDLGCDLNIPFGPQENVLGVGRIGKALGIDTVMDNGYGETKYILEVEFEDGTVASITSEPTYIKSQRFTRFALGTDPSLIMEANWEEWDPKSVKYQDEMIVAVDLVNYGGDKIKEVTYVEYIDNKEVYRNGLVAGFGCDPNIPYSQQGGLLGFGRVGDDLLCLRITADTGRGAFRYSVTVEFEGGRRMPFRSSTTTVN